MEASDLPGGARRIMLAGFLDAAAVTCLERDFAALLPDRAGVLVDLAAVEYCGSLGIRMLLSGAKLMQRRGQRLVLVGPQPAVAKVLETVGLDALVPVVPDEAAGLARLAGG